MAGMESTGWEERVAGLWDSVDAMDEQAFVAAMGRLVAELGENSAVGAYEMGSAFDSTDDPARAVAEYRRALDLGLEGSRRREVVVQLASSLRNLGEVNESVDLLTAERARTSDELDDAVTAFLALALVDAGREREATGLALGALAPHLPRYQRSLTNYARELSDGG